MSSSSLPRRPTLFDRWSEEEDEADVEQFGPPRMRPLGSGLLYGQRPASAGGYSDHDNESLATSPQLRNSRSVSPVSSANSRADLPPALSQRLNQLDDDIARLLKMPECAERSVALLVALLSALAPLTVGDSALEKLLDLKVELSSIPASPAGSSPASPSPTKPQRPHRTRVALRRAISSELQRAVDRLGVEGLTNNGQVAKIASELQLEASRGNWSGALVSARALLISIRPVDLDALFRLVQVNRAEMRVVEGMDIMLIVGNTGVGKSTLIHFLAGSEVKATTEKIIAVQPNPAIDRLRAVDTSSSIHSCTSHMLPVPVPMSALDPEYDQSIELQSYILVDTPGLADRGGAEIDIANGVSMIDAVRLSKSVRLMWVLHKSNAGVKLDLIDVQLDALIAMVKNLDLHLAKFTYVLSGWDDDERDLLRRRALETIELFQKQPHTKGLCVTVLKDIVAKLKKDPTSGAWTLGDFSGYQELSARMTLVQSVLQRKAIASPATVFCRYVAPKSSSLLNDQLTLLTSSADSAMRRGETALVLWRLQQLADVHNLIKDDQAIEQRLKDTQALLKAQLVQLHAAFSAQLDSAFNPHSQLSQLEVAQLRHLFDSLQRAEGVQHLFPKQVDLEPVANKLQRSANETVLRVKLAGLELNGDHDHEAVSVARLAALKNDLDRLHLLDKSFPELRPAVYGAAQDRLADELRVILNSILGLLKGSPPDLKQANETMRVFVRLAGAVGEHVPAGVKEETERVKDAALEVLKAERRTVQAILTRTQTSQYDATVPTFASAALLSSSSRLTASDVASLDKSVAVLEAAVLLDSPVLVTADGARQQLHDTQDKLVQRVGEYSQRVIDIANSGVPSLLANLQLPFEQLALLTGVRGVYAVASRWYNDALTKLQSHLIQHRVKLQELLADMRRRNAGLLPETRQADEEDEWQKSLTDAFDELQAAQWTTQYLSDDYTALLAMVHTDLLRHAQKTQQRMGELNLTLSGSTRYYTASSSYSTGSLSNGSSGSDSGFRPMQLARDSLIHLHSLRGVAAKQPELKEVVDEVQSRYVGQLQQAMNEIAQLVRDNTPEEAGRALLASLREKRAELKQLRAVEPAYVRLRARGLNSLAELEQRVHEINDNLRQLRLDDEAVADMADGVAAAAKAIASMEQQLQDLTSLRSQVLDSNHSQPALSQLEADIGQLELQVQDASGSEFGKQLPLARFNVAMHFLDDVYQPTAQLDNARSSLVTCVAQYVQAVQNDVLYKLELISKSVVSGDNADDSTKASYGRSIHRRVRELKAAVADKQLHPVLRAEFDSCNEPDGFFEEFHAQVDRERKRRVGSMELLELILDKSDLDAELVAMEAMAIFDADSRRVFEEFRVRAAALLGRMSEQFNKQLDNEQLDDAKRTLDSLTAGTDKRAHYLADQCTSKVRQQAVFLCRTMHNEAARDVHFTSATAVALHEHHRRLLDLLRAFHSELSEGRTAGFVQLKVEQTRELVGEMVSAQLRAIDTAIVGSSYKEASQLLAELSKAQKPVEELVPEDVKGAHTALREKLVTNRAMLISLAKAVAIEQFPFTPYKPSLVLSNVDPESQKELVEFYFEQFKGALESAKAAAGDEQQAQLAACKAAVVYYPQEMQGPLTTLVVGATSFVNKARSRLENRLALAIQSGDSLQLKQLRDELLGSSSSELLPELYKGVVSSVTALCRAVEAALRRDQSPSSESRAELAKLLSFKQHFGAALVLIEREVVTVERELARLFGLSCQNLHTAFAKGFGAVGAADSALLFFKRFYDFVRFQCDASCSSSDELRPAAFVADVSRVNDLGATAFTVQHNRFVMSLREQQAEAVLSTLSVLAAVEPLAQTVQRYCLEAALIPIYAASVKALQDTVAATPLHEAALQQLAERVASSQTALSAVQLADKDVIRNSKARETQFLGINACLRFICVIQSKATTTVRTALLAALPVDTEADLSAASRRQLSDKLLAVHRDALAALSKSPMTTEHFDSFNVQYAALLAFQDNVSNDSLAGLPLAFDMPARLDELTTKVARMVDELEAAAIRSLNDEAKLAALLVRLRVLAENLPLFEANIVASIERVLEEYGKKRPSAIDFLAAALSRLDAPQGRALASQHSMFHLWQLNLREQRTGQQTIEWALNNLRGTDINTAELQQRYNRYLGTLYGLLERFYSRTPEYGLLMRQIHDLVNLNIKDTESRSHYLLEPVPITGLQWHRASLPTLFYALCFSLGVREDQLLKQLKKALAASPELAGQAGPAFVKELSCLSKGEASHKHDVQLMANLLRREIAVIEWEGGVSRFKPKVSDKAAPALVVISYSDAHARYDGYTVIKPFWGKSLSAEEIVANLAANSSAQTMNDTWLDDATYLYLPDLIAHVAALWILQRNAKHAAVIAGSGSSSGSGPPSVAMNKLVKPHPVQVLAIFRMLSVGDEREVLQNNLVEVLTGEGKSVVLAITAVVCALLGADVNCVCYSAHLSERDYAAFEPLFAIAGVKDRVHYGTFEQLCEGFINKDGDIRKRVKQLILPSSRASTAASAAGTGAAAAEERKKVEADREEKQPSSNAGSSPSAGARHSAAASERASGKDSSRVRVLLIDEVDVFFGKDFYGCQYAPVASIKHALIKQLLKAVWESHSNKALTAEQAEAHITEAARQCKELLADWSFLIDLALLRMRADVTQFANPAYVVHGGKVGYQRLDTISYDATEGYKTAFAHFHEFEQGRVSQSELDWAVSLEVRCGLFSFAEIPKQFHYLMGVTGTLADLSPPERDIISRVYGMKRETYLPSIYGQSQRKFAKDRDLVVVPQSEHWSQVAAAMDKVLLERKRAVLVFFETKEELRVFKALQGAHFAYLEDITEETDSNVVKVAVERATNAERATLLTRSFGRGIDFICNDMKVQSNGGVHVLQTFISEALSEETQIKGRTARQGQDGSYSLLVAKEGLEKFLGPQYEEKVRAMEASGKFYDDIDEPRKQLFAQQYASRDEQIRLALPEHEHALRFLASLDCDPTFVRSFLLEANDPHAASKVVSRTLVLLDATGSMSNSIQKCKEQISTMFERTRQVLVAEGMAEAGFLLQIAAYRNYNAPDEASVLMCSGWESDPTALSRFLHNVHAKYGLNPGEAVEVGLSLANSDQSVTQVLLIGDQPANTAAETKAHRERLSHVAWGSTRFADALDCEAEVRSLASRSVPLHTFWVHPGARISFDRLAEIARQHGSPSSSSQELKVNEGNGADALTHVVTLQLLGNIGGEAKGRTLQEAYIRAYRS